MSYILIFGLLTSLATTATCCWLVWQLLQQNGRTLLRIEALEKRLEEEAESRRQKAENDQDGLAAAGIGNERADRFSNHSLAGSKIKRDGLKAGTRAPEFRLPRLDGGELALSELRGRQVLLVFSSPSCGPCNILAPKLEKFHRKHPGLELVMISRGETAENRDKVNEHGLTFPVVLQKQWEISRDYAMFATPIAYLLDGSGIIMSEVAVGVDAVLELMACAKRIMRQPGKVTGTSFAKHMVNCVGNAGSRALQ
jgi:peroxiredoxin